MPEAMAACRGWCRRWTPLALAFGILVALIRVPGATGAAGVPPGTRTAMAPATIDREHWYRLQVGEESVGWMCRRRVSLGDADGHSIVRLERQTWLHVLRAGHVVAMETESAFEETRDGRPVSACVRTTEGEGWSEVQWRFDEASIVERREEDGRVGTSSRPRPATPWLTPSAADLLVAGRIEAGADRIQWSTLEPESGLALVRITMDAEGRDEVEVEGRSVAATRWRVSSSAAPGLETLQWRSRDGHLLVEQTETAIGRLTARLTSREDALAAASGTPVEILAPALIEPRGRIDPRWRVIRYVIRHAGGGESPPMPSGGPQAVERAPEGMRDEADDGDWWLVTIDPQADVAGDAPGTEADLSATPLIDASDEAVRALAARAIRNAGPEPSDAARAEALRLAVRDHIERKDLDRLMDSASRAVRTRRGDCSEHAVLLAAVLRARGIPARLAGGLVHVEAIGGREHVFAWHMWTRALVEDRWIDLDATRRRAFGPTHLRLAETAGDGGAVIAGLADLLAGVGRLEIRILGGER